MEVERRPERKFQNPDITAKGERRAWIDPVQFNTVWFNTGTLCNLECKGCYIESSPRNDRLVYITAAEVIEYLDEIQKENMGTEEIALTGGEPFMNKEILPILKACLKRGFSTLILTNAMKPMQRFKKELFKLKLEYGDKLKIRVSIDHYLEEKHSEERGIKAWAPAVEGLKWLSENKFDFSVAGRTCWGETDADLRSGYDRFFREKNISLDTSNPEKLVLFPEMDESIDVPEITTECWGILDINPNDIMCATSRMIVKRKGQDKPVVLACTLLPYDKRFEMGQTLKESFKAVKLNHLHCAKFCVLGGGSCSKG